LIPNNADSIDGLIAQGYAFHQAGQLAQANAIYQKALKDNPRNARLLYLMGVLQQTLGNDERALNFFNRAKKADPSNALFCLHAGVSFSKLNQFLQAIESYEAAIELNPDYFEAFSNLGNAFLAVGDFDKALTAYERALALRDDVATVHYNLGVVCQTIMRPSAAIIHYQRAIELEPEYAGAYCNLSVALAETGLLEQARSANEKALELDPTLAEAHFNAHSHHLARADLTLAVESLKSANRLSPKNDKYRFFLGASLAFAGEIPLAKQFLSFKNPSKQITADLDAWDYLQQCKPVPVMLGNSLDVFKFALQGARPDGLVLEFGVYQGTSIRQLAGLVDGDVHGFDSFEGIPEAWNHEKAGSYSMKGSLPEVPDNVFLHRGWFEDSIPSFLVGRKESVRLMNIDCDLYTSTKTVLDQFAGHITEGSVLVFDEFIGNPSWRQDEFKAFSEAACNYNWHFEVICFSFVTKQVAIRIQNS